MNKYENNEDSLEKHMKIQCLNKREIISDGATITIMNENDILASDKFENVSIVKIDDSSSIFAPSIEFKFNNKMISVPVTLSKRKDFELIKSYFSIQMGKYSLLEQHRKEIIDKYENQKIPGDSSSGTSKEIRHLRKMLYSDEKVLQVASGIMEGNTWLIACTTKRIIFIDCGMLYGVKHSEIMIDKVNAVSFKNGFMRGEIHVEDGASTRIITNISNSSTKPFVDAVHKAMEISKKSNQIIVQNQPQNLSIADEIMKFKSLLDNGIISQEEFEQQKKKLLNA